MSQAASVSLGQMLEVNSVSVLQPSEPFLHSRLSWPLPALLAELRLQGRTRSPGEAAGSADARGNTAAGCKAQLELSLMSWNTIHQSLQPETAFLLFCFLFLYLVKLLFWLEGGGHTGETFMIGRESFGPQFIITLHTAQINQPLFAYL